MWRFHGLLLEAAVERRDGESGGGVFSASSAPFIHLDRTECILASEVGVRDAICIFGVEALVTAREAMPSYRSAFFRCISLSSERRCRISSRGLGWGWVGGVVW